MRIRKTSVKQAETRVATINLRAYPAPPNSVPVLAPDKLKTEFFGRTIDASTENRKRFGRTLSMDRIESALMAAFRGSMSEITDVLHETVDTDPHLGSILNKRFGALAALPFEVQPAAGTGIDRDKAMFYAEVVRAQIRNMKSFRRNVSQLAWALFNGRACLEKNWIEIPPESGFTHPRYGTVTLAVTDMDWIHPRRLNFGPKREIRIQPESGSGGGNFSNSGISVLDMPDKFLWWLPQLFNEYPEREGLGMRVMYWSFFKRFAARERMILTELFGKPWRITTVDPESSAGEDELTQADRIVDALGASHTARMPRGTKLEVISPGKSAGEVHADVIKDADLQNSKLVLGQTGTTDGVPSGLNNSQANVMQDEQLGVLIRDAGMLSEVIETGLTDRMIALNFGELEVTHAPTFRFRADLPADRTAEISRLQSALQAGLSVQRSEAYEISGFSEPEPTDVVISMEQPPTPPNSPVAPAVRPVTVYPVGTAPALGQQQPPVPAVPLEVEDSGSAAQVGVVDSAKTITVNEDRAARGLPPLALPDGSPDPRGLMTVAEFGKEMESRYAPEQPGTSDLPEAPMGIAASKVLAYDVNDAFMDGDEPTGDGGVHMHAVRRSLESTALDGLHAHVFKIGDSYFSTFHDGAHMHALGTSDDTETLRDGEHGHSVILPDGTATITTEDGSAHQHELQISTSAVDGSHTHTIVIPSISNPAGYESVRSLTSAELARDIEANLIPPSLFEDMDQMAIGAVTPYLVITSRQIERTLKEVESVRVKLTGAPVVTTPSGSPDDLVNRGMKELNAQTSAWASVFESEVANEVTVYGTYNALIRARRKLEISKFGRVMERNKLHSLMLGVVDSVRDVAQLDAGANEAVVDSVTSVSSEMGNALQSVGLTKVNLSKIVLEKTPFSKMPFKSALEWFKKLALLDRPSFERASAKIKQRAFTVAGVTADQMLGVLQSDLLKSIKAGDDLKKFKARIRPRLEDAGFLAKLEPLKTGEAALNPTHVETVFRTNALNTYNTGRFVHQSSPSVKAAFPVWEIRGIDDSRTRPTHRAVQGKKLLANDPFWDTAYPPFGWNCRERVIPRTAKEIPNVVPGSSIEGLPDPGFISGKSALALG